MGTLSLTPSRVTAAPGAYVVEWSLPDAEIAFEADKLRNHTDGRLQARVRVTATLSGGERLVLHHGNLNLAAGQSRRGLSRALEERLPSESNAWDQVVEESCRAVLEHEERGYEVERLAITDRLSPEYLLEPVVLAGVANLLFAPGGGGKSYLGLYLALLAENGLSFDLQPGRQTNTLFLDYETSREEMARRCTLLAAGLEQRVAGMCFAFPHYGRGLGTLADRVSDIARVVAEKKIGLLIVDSAGAAAGGDILTAETAVRFFEAVRVATASTGAAALVFTHVTKTDSRQDDAHRAPFGSAYFTNLSRLVWELRPQETSRDDVLQIGLFCRKANAGRQGPLGFRFTFEPGAVVVDQCGTTDVLTEQGAIRAMILEELKHGAAGPGELAEAIGTTPGTVSKTLTDMKKRGTVENVARGQWIRTHAAEEDE